MAHLPMNATQQMQHKKRLQQVANDSDDEVVGDESCSMISQPDKSPGISPGLSAKSRGSPRGLFYGERSRESFSNKGFGPGNKMRQSKQHQQYSNTFLSESTITEDPEKISVPNRSQQYAQ